MYTSIFSAKPNMKRLNKFVQKKGLIEKLDMINFDIKKNRNRGLSYFVFGVLLMFAQVTSAANVDLSIRQSTSISSPIVGADVSFTIVLKNSGPQTAGSIVVDETLPMAGISNVTYAATKGTWVYSPTFGTGKWNVLTLAAGDSAVLVLNAKIAKPGLFYSFAEIAFNADTDIDSSPGNFGATEDDYSLACFATPVTLSPSDTYKVDVPQIFAGGLGISWFRNGVKILTSDANATINADSSLTIKTAGQYTYTSNKIACTTGRFDCCKIEVVSLPAIAVDLALRKTILTTGEVFPGSNVVFKIDVFNQGANQVTEVKVSDYVPAGLTLNDLDWTQTGNVAVYNNPNLIINAGQSVPLTINFKVNANYTGATIRNNAEVSAAKGALGETVVDIDSNLDNIANNDTTIADNDITQNGKNGGDEDDFDYAVLTLGKFVTIGDYVWNDLNKNGVQDLTDPGISGAVVRLENPDGSIVNTTLTDAGGKYLFSNVLPGTYLVAVNIPSGFQLTSPNTGTNDNVDSDFNLANGKTDAKVFTSGQNDISIDAGFFAQSCNQINSVSTSKPNICAGDTSTIQAISTGNVQIEWYAAATGGNALFTSNSGQNLKVIPTVATTYYAQIANLPVGCSATRIPITLNINARASAPIVNTPIDLCTGSTLNLNTKITSGVSTVNGVFEWHVGPLSTSALVANAAAVTAAGTYYAFEKSSIGCYSISAPAVVIAKDCGKPIDLELSKTADKRIVNVNDNILFTITVINKGPNRATNIKISDKLPTSLTFVSSNTLTNVGGTLGLNIPALDSGQTVSYTYIAKANIIGTIINVAEVASADQKDGDSNPGNAATVNEDDDDDEVINVVDPNPSADLSLTKAASGSTFFTNDNVTYTVSVKNNGPSVATNVEVRDLLPAGLTLISANSGDLVIVKGDTITATFNKIEVGQELDLFIVAKITKGGSIVNRAEVMKSSLPDPDSTPGAIANEDDDDVNTITVTDQCNPTTPLISASNLFVCGGETITLTAANCNGTVVWSNAATGNSITVTPTVNTIYTAKCQVGLAACQSPASNALNVTINSLAAPLVTLSSAPVCTGSSVTLTASNCTGTITWSSGATGATLSVVATDVAVNYTAICKVSTCTSVASQPVSVKGGSTTSAPVITASKTIVCVNEPITLSATGCTGGTVTWSNNQSGATITVTPTAAITYTATCTVNFCVSPASNAINVSINTATPTPTISASKETTCGGESITLTAANCAGTLLWSNAATTTVITVTPTVTTTYTATCTVGTCSGIATKAITVGGLGITPTITANKTAVCLGDSTTLTAANCTGTLNWTQGVSTTVLRTGLTFKVSPAANTLYTGTCTSGTGCAGFSTIAITVTPLPQAPIVTAGAATICAGDSVNLTASNCTGAVSWSNNAQGTTIKVKPTATTSYTATCTLNACPSLKSTPVTVNVATKVPTITSTVETVCLGDSATFTAGNCVGGTLLWSTNATTVSIKVKPTATTTYTVACSVGSCSASASKLIFLGQKPVITASKNGLCLGDSTVLTASSCLGTVNWTFGTSITSLGNALTLKAKPIVTGQYNVTCTTLAGCTGSGNLTVNVNPRPVAPIIAANVTTICPGDSATLTSNACVGTVLWSNNATGLSIKVKPTVTTSYTAICDATGCKSLNSNAINITIGPKALPTITATLDIICVGDSSTLTAANCVGGPLLWSTNATTASIKVKPTITTTYTATCGTGACAGIASKTITINTGQTPTITASKTAFCQGDSSVLTAAGCTGTLNWTLGDAATILGTGLTFKAKPTATAIYKASCGTGTCAKSSTITLTVTPIAAPVITASKTNPCPSESVTLTASGCTGGTYIWSNAAVTPVITVIQAATTTYSVKCVVGSCERSTSQEIVVGVPLDLSLSASKTATCPGETTSITASNCSTTLTWSDATLVGNAVTVSPTITTTYTATCAASTCKAALTKTITITVNGSAIASPVVTALANVCPIVTVDLNKGVTSAIPTGYILSFRTGNIITAPTVPTPAAVGVSGDYFAYLTSPTGCVSAPGLIKATITACSTNPNDADIIVSINVNKTDVVIGDTVTYTIKVKNNGPATATNIKIENTLPTNLEIVGTTPGLTLLNGKLTTTIPFLLNKGEAIFTYKAKLTKSGVARNSITSVSADQSDPIVLNNSSYVELECLTCAATCIGAALRADTTSAANGTYNIKFTALVRNCGNVQFDSTEVTHDILAMFPSPSVFTIVQAPKAGIGSLLTTNASFDGKLNKGLLVKNTSKLLQGKVDTITYVINVKPASLLVTYNTNTSARGIGTSTLGTGTILENNDLLSNDGSKVDKPSSTPTVVRFFKSPSLGLAKSIEDTVKLANGSYDIRYKFIIKNSSQLNLTAVALVDSMKDFIAPATFTITKSPSKNTSSALVVNPAFNGKTDYRLLLPTGTMVAGKVDTIRITINLVPAGKNEFSNQAVGSGTGRLPDGTDEIAIDYSNAGINPDAIGKVPTVFRLPTPKGDTVCIGAALTTVNKIKQTDGSWNVTYKATIKNCGNVKLQNIQICDTLSNTFPVGVTVKVIGDPIVSAGSKLKVDTSFNGVTKKCLVLADTSGTMAPQKIDTLQWTLNITLNGSTGPFKNNLTIFAGDKNGKPTSDVSNDGINPNPIGSLPTIITFDENFKDSLIGTAKRLVSLEKVLGKDKVYDVKFEFVLRNYGQTNMTKVNLQDNLSASFGTLVTIDSVSVTADSGLVVNKNFTGKGDLIYTLNDTLSNLKAKESKKIKMLVRVDMSKADTLKYENFALGVGFIGTKSFNDASQDGINPDKDGSGDPTNDSDPTPIFFDGLDLAPKTPIGIGKSVDSVKTVDGSYLLTYKIVAKNFGKNKIDSLQLTEDLAEVFSNKTTFELVGKPFINKGATLKLDTAFNGKLKKNLLKADSSSLAPGKADTITLKVKVLNQDVEDQTYLNTVTAKAWVKDTLFTDKSNNGLEPDKNKDNNPGNDNEPTPIKLPAAKEDTTMVDVFITNGISPNNDTKNDVFVVKDKNNKTILKEEDEINVHIYNRWYILVYKSENYIKDFKAGNGWKGGSNTGVRIDESEFLPDGTYYYVVESKNKRLFNNKPAISFITLKR
jgi:large repetitive protein